MIDNSKLRQNGLRRLAKQPHTLVAAASLFGILSYRMVSLVQFGNKIVNGDKETITSIPAHPLNYGPPPDTRSRPRKGSHRRTERFETSEI
jgi:hypothetical protein